MTRRAVVSDATAIADVHVAAWRAAYRGLLPDDLPDRLDVTRRADAWRRILADAGHGVRVADEGGQVVGFVSTSPSRDEDAGTAVGEIQAIYVQPALWGSGHGSLLHAAALDDLVHRGMTRATLWVLEENARTRAVYERWGWSPDGTTKDERFGDAVVTEVRLERRIA